MGAYDLCKPCTIRHCRRTPKKKGMRYVCAKRRVYKNGVSMLELAMYRSPEATLTMIHEHGLQVTKGKKGLRVSKRKLS